MGGKAKTYSYMSLLIFLINKVSIWSQIYPPINWLHSLIKVTSDPKIFANNIPSTNSSKIINPTQGGVGEQGKNHFLIRGLNNNYFNEKSEYARPDLPPNKLAPLTY